MLRAVAWGRDSTNPLAPIRTFRREVCKQHGFGGSQGAPSLPPGQPSPSETWRLVSRRAQEDGEVEEGQAALLGL